MYQCLQWVTLDMDIQVDMMRTRNACDPHTIHIKAQ
jgi:hypothetical protein